MVLTKKREADRSILLMTRRPSMTTEGRAAKSEFKSTNWETWQAASLPAAMAMLQSASLRASTSLTPSPVMATVCPVFLRARTRVRFWSGLTRPKTLAFPAASASASSDRADASTASSAPAIPARLATSETVVGLSPEMTLTVTPCSAK